MNYNFSVNGRLLRLVVVIAVMVSACAFYKPRKPENAPTHEEMGAVAEITYRDLPYVEGMEDNDLLKLDVYSNPHEGLWPGVVMIHGGAWIMGDKEMDNFIYLCKALANNGYVVFNISYRLAPKTKIREQSEDAMAAVIWAKEHAVKYGADPERFGVVGGSAGGHLAALVAWASDDPYFTPTGDPKSKYDSDVKVAALYYPVLDFNRTLHDMGHFMAPLSRRFFTGLGGKKYKEALKHLSPKYHIEPGIPPTMLLCGDKDVFKLYPQMAEYEAMLKEAGVDTKLYIAPGKDHGFTWQYWEPETVNSVKEIVSFFNKYLRKPIL